MTGELKKKNMDKLIQIRVFVRVAERGSFSAAGRELHVSQSAVSKAITMLERGLGARLVNRSTRSVSLTEAGARYYERCRPIISDLDEADAAVNDLNRGAVGSLKIAAPVPFGLMFISPRAARFQASHPLLKIDLDLNDQPLSLVEENIDVAIRLGHLTHPSLVARKIAESPFLAVAAPAYLSARGIPRSPKDLAAHHCLLYTQQTHPKEWAFTNKSSVQSVTVDGNYQSNNLISLKDAAVAGIGIARLPLWMVDTEIKTGSLHRVLEKHPLPAFGIHAVFPTARQIPAKVRLFVDFLQTELSTVPYFLKS